MAFAPTAPGRAATLVRVFTIAAPLIAAPTGAAPRAATPLFRFTFPFLCASLTPFATSFRAALLVAPLIGATLLPAWSDFFEFMGLFG
jgi:hypothetical protein